MQANLIPLQTVHHSVHNYSDTKLQYISQTNLIRGFTLCCLITSNTYCWVCHDKFLAVCSQAQCVKPSPKQIRLMTQIQRLTDFCMNLVELLVSISLPFYPQQEVSRVMVGHFCVPLKVMVKGRWLCSDKKLSLRH